MLEVRRDILGVMRVSQMNSAVRRIVIALFKSVIVHSRKIHHYDVIASRVAYYHP